MAIMSETPIIDASATLDEGITAPPPTSAQADLKVNGTNGHVEPPPTPAISDDTKINGNTGGADVQMEDVDIAFSGKNEPSNDALSSAPINPIEETAAVPPPISQPLSDVRDESLPPIPTTEQPEVEDEPEPMLIDEPETKLEETSPPQAAGEMDSEEVSLLAAPVTQDDSAPAMSQSIGQVRPREEEDDEEQPVKRTKLTPEGEDSAAVPTSTSMAPPALPGAPNAAPTDWDSRPMTEPQRKFLLESTRKAKKTKAAIPFINPVDPVALGIPKYPEIVKEPMDLSTLEDNLKANKYPTANVFWSQFELIVKNAQLFNGPQHTVTQSGYNLQAYFAKMMQSLPKGDASQDANKKKAVPTPKPSLPRRESRSAAVAKVVPPANTPTTVVPTTTSKSSTPKAKSEPKKHEAQLDANGVPVIRRDSESNRPKREIIKPPPRDLPYTTVKPKKKQTQLELKFCEQTVKEIKKPKYGHLNYAFMAPVDPVALNIPTYFTIVKKPMDFGTIEKKLSEGAYNSAKEFHIDAKLVFNNCYSFNPEGDPINSLGKQLEKVFDDQWKKKDEFIAANMPPSEPPSEDESAESSDESEVEDKSARMLEIQQQIAALSAELVSLSKAPTSKKSKKKDKKSKGEKVKRQSTSSSAPVKKSSKQSKPVKVKRLTLEQKRFVSEGIGQLDEANMRKAVQIIRNGVPKLRDVHDDELELDVDEIPDNVLHELLRFVKGYRKDNNLDEDDDDYEAETVKQHSTTQRKKSKPMSAREQESKIAQVQERLQQFNNQSGSDQNDGAQDDSDEDDSSSSEEE